MVQLNRGTRFQNSHSGRKTKAATAKRRAVISKVFNSLTPPRRATRTNPDQISTAPAASKYPVLNGGADMNLGTHDCQVVADTPQMPLLSFQVSLGKGMPLQPAFGQGEFYLTAVNLQLDRREVVVHTATVKDHRHPQQDRQTNQVRVI